MKKVIGWSCVIAVVCCSFLIYPGPTGEWKNKTTLRILSYNIHHAAPPAQPDKIDLDAIAKVIRDQKPDLVALQEVDVFTGRSGPYNQAVELGAKTGLRPYFFKAINYDGGEYGVAILSRYPVTDTTRYPLPSEPGKKSEARVLGTAVIQLPGRRNILFACTHLDAGRDSVNRQLQIDAIDKALAASKIPAIVAGDLNAVPSSGVISTLDRRFHRTCDPCAFTSPADKPRRTIDYIAFTSSSGFSVKDHFVVQESEASDHLPVMAIIAIK